jgi:ribosomal protein S18 acetylase RimI-like enzyme
MIPTPVGCRFERMSQAHLKEVVDLHEKCFANYYLSDLGSSFLEALYGWYVHDPEAIAHVAVDANGRVVGFVAGTADESDYRSSLFGASWYNMAIALARRFTSRPALTLRLIAERKDYVLDALGTLLTPRRERPGQADANSDQPGPTASLVSIAVNPSARRSGIGAALTGLFLMEAWNRGCKRVTLSVREDNQAARRFYESLKWDRMARSSKMYRGSFSIVYGKVRNDDTT